MPHTTLVAGTVITASWANTNVRDQVVAQHASVASRDAAVTSPLEGMLHYTSAEDAFWAYTGSAWVQIGPITGAWTAYTPTITQSGSVAKTVTYARWMRIGRTVICAGSVAITGTGTASNTVTVSLPVTAASGANIGCGVAHIYDVSAAVNYSDIAILDATTTFAIMAGGTGGRLGNATFTAGLASGDALGWTVTYEAAS
ncbi:MAG: hypothetical protein ACKVWR_00195 [Acidimicrobiales bacterium]